LPRPKPVEDLLSEAFDLYRLHFRLLLTVAAVGLLPVSLAKDMLVPLFAGAVSPSASLVSAFLLLPVLGLAQLLTQGALMVAAVDAIAGGEAGVLAAWSGALARFAPLLGTSILVAAGTLLGGFLCLVPGLLFWAGCLFVTPAVLLEERSSVAAVKRSLQAMRADPGRSLILAACLGVVVLGAGMVGGLLLPPGHLFAGAVVADLVTLVVLPFPVLAIVLLFEDIQRTRWGIPEVTMRRQSDRLVASEWDEALED
jgi:hypothetical protein